MPIFFLLIVSTVPAATRVAPGVAMKRSSELKAGAHASEPSFFSKGVVPRNILKPGFKDTGVVAVRLRASGGGMAARFGNL